MLAAATAAGCGAALHGLTALSRHVTLNTPSLSALLSALMATLNEPPLQSMHQAAIGARLPALPERWCTHPALCGAFHGGSAFGCEGRSAVLRSLCGPALLFC